MASTGGRGKACRKHSFITPDLEIPQDRLPFDIQQTKVIYKTGRKNENTWYYHLPPEWKIESSKRVIMNNDQLTPDVKLISLMISEFFLRNEHAYIGKNGMRCGYLRFFKENRDKIAANKNQLYAISLANHLVSRDIFTPHDYSLVFDDMCGTLIKNKSK